MNHLATLLCLLVVACPVSAATIDAIADWPLSADPPHAGATVLGTTNPNASAFQLSGNVPPAVDIGRRSVDGNTVAGSSSGWAFSPASDFEIAIDYSTLANTSAGGVGIGFGIGLEGTGENSAGVVVAFNDGAPQLVGGAGRVANANQPAALVLTPATAAGRLFVRYTSLSGDIHVGHSSTPGVNVGDAYALLSSIQQGWNSTEPLLASFFLRSQGLPIGAGHTAGTFEATFSNFEILSGSALSVPEPGMTLLLSSGLSGVLIRRRIRSRN